MIDKLKMYLNGAVSFEEACSIFFILCKNKKLAQNLMRGEKSDYKEEKLKYEVGKIIKEHPAASKISTELVQEIQSSVNNSKKESVFVAPVVFHYPTDPEPTINPNQSFLDKILTERKELYQIRGHLHGRLHQIEDEAESYEVAKQIIEIQPKIDELNAERDIIENGGIPSRFLKKHISAEQYVEARNTKQYIARYKKNLAESKTVADKKKYQELIEKYETKLKSL